MLPRPGGIVNGLVHRLLDRSRAPVAGVRPRPAALFERSARTADVPASDAGAPTRPVDVTAPAEPPDPVAIVVEFDPARAKRPPDPVPRTDRPAATPRRQPTTDDAQATPESIRPAPVAVRQPVTADGRARREPAADVGPGADPVGAPRHTGPTLIRPAPGGLARTAAGRDPLPARVLIDRWPPAPPPFLRSPAGPALATPAGTLPDPPPPTVVEVSIGRLEVRTPPAAATPPRQPRKDQTATLEMYLRRRGKGELA
jgi:hypothetical protein